MQSPLCRTAVPRAEAPGRQARAGAVDPVAGKKVELIVGGPAPIIVGEVLAALRRIHTEEGTAAIIVEEKARTVLAITERAIILNRGRLVYSGASADLLARPDLLDAHLGARDKRSEQATRSGKAATGTDEKEARSGKAATGTDEKRALMDRSPQQE